MPISEVSCFFYSGIAFTATLVVEADPSGQMRVHCPIRRGFYDLTPEEEVRQALIWFLTEGGERAKVLKQRLRIAVEESSLDVAAFFTAFSAPEKFRANIPVVIIETKRPECSLRDHLGQLRLYMLRERCRSGLLFNGREAIWVSKDGGIERPEWILSLLPDFNAVEDRIEEASLAMAPFVAGCEADFIAAACGDFDSFCRLVSLFGADLSLTFMLSVRINHELTSVQACSLRMAEGMVTYWQRGVRGKHRLQLSREDFHALVRVQPI